MSDPRMVLPGTKPGDRRVRVGRPLARYFRYEAPGVVSAKLAAEEPTTPLGRPHRTGVDPPTAAATAVGA